MLRHRGLTALLAVFALAGCRADNGNNTVDTTAQPPVQDPAMTAPQPEPAMRLEVSIAARELYVYRNGQRAETHQVAVGTEEWPTRTGEWTIDEVVFNPRWVPPDEEWAEDEDEEEPGAETNPLGRAQLVYDRPRSIHGTNEPGSIGQAVSHGSIRVRNEVALQLARQVMEAAGVENVDERVREGEQNRNREVTVRLPRGIPISVVERSAAGGAGGTGAGTGAGMGAGTSTRPNP
jgi:lipoprotein-anchoring transpeptidase ErfK/SrfK